MRLTVSFALFAAAFALATTPCAVQAQQPLQPTRAAVPTPPPLAADGTAPLPSASAASTPARAPAQRPQVAVIEDDEVRIEETRVRGQTQRIVVQSKRPGVRPYEIIVGPGAKDSSQDRGATGQRAWSLFAF